MRYLSLILIVLVLTACARPNVNSSSESTTGEFDCAFLTNPVIVTSNNEITYCGILNRAGVLILNDYLLNNDNIKVLNISSSGGDTILARAISRYANENAIIVRIYSICLSACFEIATFGQVVQIQDHTVLGNHNSITSLWNYADMIVGDCHDTLETGCMFRESEGWLQFTEQAKASASILGYDHRDTRFLYDIAATDVQCFGALSPDGNFLIALDGKKLIKRRYDIWVVRSDALNTIRRTFNRPLIDDWRSDRVLELKIVSLITKDPSRVRYGGGYFGVERSESTMCKL